MSAPGEFVPTDGSLAAVEWLDNWDGQGGNLCRGIAVWRHGEWWPDEGGGRLLEFEGNKILSIWPMTEDRKIEIKEEIHFWDPNVKHKE